MSFSDIQTPTSQWFSPVSWIFLCTFLDILSQLPGYSFVVSRFSWATLYIIFQTSKLVSGSCSIGIRLPFGLCPIVVQLMFCNAFSIHFEHHDNVMSQSLLSNEGVRVFDFCDLTCVYACTRNASSNSSCKVK